MIASRGMRIFCLASEMVPWISTGGLGQMTGNLVSSLREAGCSITVLLPFYRDLARSPLCPPLEVLEERTVALGHSIFHVRLLHARSGDGIQLLLADCGPLYDRPGIYAAAGHDHPDNDLRFGLLCELGLDLLRRPDFASDIVHVHDWPGALLPLRIAQERKKDPFFPELRTLLTVHNLAHQGIFSIESLQRLGIPEDFASRSGLERAGQVNFLRGGLMQADGINTVSRSYARQTLQGADAFGLEDVLRGRRGDWAGILNGIDPRQWDPAREDPPALPFDSGSLKRRSPNRIALRKVMGLRQDTRAPLLGYLGRLAHQKGIDLLLESAESLLEQGAQLVFLTEGAPEDVAALENLVRKHPRHVAMREPYDPDFARLFLAGIDILLMPSRFEPCGISQMQAMRYGAIVVAHATGGLKDSIHPVSAGKGRDHGTGFFFHTYTARAFQRAIGQAIRMWRHRSTWTRMQRMAMRQDLSIARSRDEYLKLYQALRRRPLRRASEPVEEKPKAEAIAAHTADWGPPLSDFAEESHLRLMMQSPHTLFAHWQLPRANGDIALPLSLWLHEKDAPHPRRVGENLRRNGESWISVQPEGNFQVLLKDAQGTVLLSSDRVTTPRIQIAPTASAQWAKWEAPRFQDRPYPDFPLLELEESSDEDPVASAIEEESLPLTAAEESLVYPSERAIRQLREASLHSLQWYHWPSSWMLPGKQKHE